MRWSSSFIPTLREEPADAEAMSHRLMVRAGLVRQLTAGVYVYLPLGQRVIDRVNAIIREEMNGIGGQEVTMPVLHPAELWQQSGRWYDIKDEMFRLKDRHGRDMCLGMTHEEVVRSARTGSCPRSGTRSRPRSATRPGRGPASSGRASSG
jgi:prolyl-tRNA synthetase